MSKYGTSKLKTLEYLYNRIFEFKIPELHSFQVFFYKKNTSHCIDEIIEKFSGNIIIRSSAADEDGQHNSAAGEYESILNVPSNNSEKITAAINKVIASYEKKRPLLPGDEVIIQNMVQNTIMSGVIFTHDLNTGAPYYFINYDDKSGATDTVTSGSGKYSNRTLYIHRNSVNQLKSERFIKLMSAVQELEKTMESQFLDIEFALDSDLNTYLLQVRTITTQPNWNRAVSKSIDSVLQGVQSFIVKRFKRLDGVYGRTTVLGQMPDWNPVEMIGRVPRGLATSLYQTLITDHAWRVARSVMGYDVPTGQPLMLILAGQPFIDTRISFHSYIPRSVSPIISEKLVNHWVEQLKQSPGLHDKIEFEIAITAYSFDIDEKIERLIGDVLTTSEKEEFKRAHLQQTSRMIKGIGKGSIDKALDKVNILKRKQKENANSSHRDIHSLFSMIDDCIQLGTIPFSILARHGFIAKTILLSLKNCEILTNDEVNQIEGSIQTVASKLVSDIRSLQLGKISYSKFMKKYGHLRPGTYDIMSHRYDQMGNTLSDGVSTFCVEHNKDLFKLSQKQKQQIDLMLKNDGFQEFNADDLLNYINEAIVGREYGKFVFTRTVSDMLELLANFSEENGLSREEISYIPINHIIDILKNSSEYNIEERLRSLSSKEMEKHNVSVSIRLPQLLIDQSGAHIIPFQVSHPNFITNKKITSQCIVITSDVDNLSLSDKVVMIEGADPGFDWIFSQNISGLITKYGGVNSHMAIRCAEFGIPAAIGCGEQRFDLLSKLNQVHLDCAVGLVSPIH